MNIGRYKIEHWSKNKAAIDYIHKKIGSAYKTIKDMINDPEVHHDLDYHYSVTYNNKLILIFSPSVYDKTEKGFSDIINKKLGLKTDLVNIIGYNKYTVAPYMSLDDKEAAQFLIEIYNNNDSYIKMFKLPNAPIIVDLYEDFGVNEKIYQRAFSNAGIIYKNIYNSLYANLTSQKASQSNNKRRSPEKKRMFDVLKKSMGF